MGIRAAVRLALAVGLLAAGVIMLGAQPVATASCAMGRPERSPYAFVGTVIDTRSADRIATVVLDDGARVTVRGTEVGWFSRSLSEVDRRYAVGARYEFHPLNGSDPYRDNACTATRKLAGPDLRPVQPSDDVLPGWLPVDEQAGPIYAVIALPVVAAAIGVLVVVRRRRRHAPRR